jgi:hypothetical protein
VIGWLQKPSTLIWGVYLAAAELGSNLPSYSFSCILVSDENHAKDYSGNQTCATVHEAVFRFLRFIWVHADRDNINAFAAVAVAVFTFTLWRSTLKLWEVGEKQITVAKESADAATRAVETNEKQMRAYIGFSGHSLNERKEFIITVKNFGNTQAHNVTGHLNMYWLQSGQELPIDFEFLDYHGFNRRRSRYIISANQEVPYNFYIDPTKLDQLKAGELALYIYGHFDYIDIFGKNRTSLFCYEGIRLEGGKGAFIAYDRHNEST